MFSRMFMSVSTMLFCFILLSCLDYSYSHKEVNQIQKPVQLSGEKLVNHGCPSWFIPVSNDSNHCKCGEPIHHPGRIVLCDSNTKQTLLLIGKCMDYNEEEDVVFIGECPFTNQGGDVDGEYVYIKPPRNVSELNQFLCGELNRTGILCSQCQEGLGTAIFSYSMKCLPCMSSGLGWTLYVFLATFPTTILFLFMLMFQVRITSGPLNAYIFACQLVVSAITWSITFESTSATIHVVVLTLSTIYGVWNLDFFRYLIPPFCASDQISPLQVVALEYTVAFYPLLLTVVAYICVQLHARDCRVMVCLWRVFCKCFSSCRRRWRKQWDPVTSLVHTFAAFLLLSYSKILFISLQLLSCTQLYVPTGGVLDPPRRVYHDPSLEWFGNKHLPFALLAIFVFCIFVFFPALVLLLYPTKLFQKCLGCCGRSWLALHAFADVLQGCYKNGTNGTMDCRYFAGLYLILRIVLLLAMYGGSNGVFNMYNGMVSIVCLVIAALVFLLFRPYKDNWLNIWDSTLFSVFAFALFCNMYTRYVAPVPFQILGVLATVPLIYFIVYVTYKLLTWTKTFHICKKRTECPTGLQSQEPDRLLHPEEYGSEEEHKPLLVGGEGDNSGNCPQDIETETYPPCRNSQQPGYRAVYSTLA